MPNYNNLVRAARRRAKTIINRLERENEGKSAEERRRAELYIERLQQNVAQTYAPRGRARTEENIRAIERLAQRTSIPHRTDQGRSNLIFQSELAAARSGDISTLPEGERGVNIFYKATKNIWKGLPSEERNAAIMEHFGVASLEEAYNLVLAQNQAALKFQADSEGWQDGGTESTGGKIDSPPELALVTYVD